MLPPAVSLACRTAISVMTPRTVSMSEVGQVAPPLQPTVAAASSAVRRRQAIGNKLLALSSEHKVPRTGKGCLARHLIVRDPCS